MPRRLAAFPAILLALPLIGAGFGAGFGADARATDAGDTGQATDCIMGPEPNDSPGAASPITGPACLAGTLPEGDQDLYLWDITSADRRHGWDLELAGVPGTRTIMDLRAVTSEPGIEPPAVGGPLLVLTAGMGATEPARRDGVLLLPGRYLVSVSAGGAGGSSGPSSAPGSTALGSETGSTGQDGAASQPGNDRAYTVALAQGAALPPAGDVEPNDDAARATPVSDAFALSGDLPESPDVYRWTVAPDAAGAWTLSSTLPLGSGGTLTLSTADGSAILVRGQPVDGEVILPDLVLEPGDYLVTVGPASESPYVLEAVGTDAPVGDPEPDDTQAQAVALPAAQPLARGRLARPQDEDWYRLNVGEALAAETLNVRMIWRSGLRRELCLYGSDTQALSCRDGTDGINISGLSLPIGSYTLRVRGEPAPEDAYLIRVDPAGPPGVGVEREPNDTPASATALHAGSTMRGRALGIDVDHFRLTVGGEPQLWQVNVEGSGIQAVEWIRPDGERLGSAAVSGDGSSALLTDLYLPPGEHWFRVKADDGDYEISTMPLGPPDPAAEREPNDLPAREERLVVGRARVGRLPTATDVDVYRFTVRGTDHLLLTVDPPADGELQALVQDGLGLSRRLRATAGEPIADDLLLGPGDYRVVLTPVVPSTDHYSISLEHLDPFRLADDQEPNDRARDARPFPASGIVEGTATTGVDTDWYVLPGQAVGTPVTIAAEGGVTAMALRDGTVDQTLFVGADGVTYQSSPLPTDTQLLLRVSANGPYTLTLASASSPASAVTPPPAEGPTVAGLGAELSLDTTSVAAWWPTGQRLAGSLELVNQATSDETVTLEAMASDRSWQVELPSNPIDMSPGASLEVPIGVLAPDDVRADAPVRISLRATSTSGDKATTGVEIQPSRDALPDVEVRVWPVPDALLGGLDVASLALGATPIPSLDAIGEERLHDGVVATDWGLAYPIAGLPVTLTVDLAGDEAVPVAGTIIQPFSEDPTLADSARDIELALSMDGSTWQKVLHGSLDPVSAEQSFVLAEPVEARFAQLRVISGQREQPSRLDLGEWKVVATPGWSPPGGLLDLANPQAGGHVVWMTPQPGSASQPASLLDADLSAQQVTVEKGSDVQWVVGFMDDRAALVSTIGWQDPVLSDAKARLAHVEMAASAGSPLGPWQALGTWNLKRGPNGAVQPFELAEPTWARFLRFSGPVGKKQTQVELPGRIEVLEAPQGADYHSILGQWGMGSAEGPRAWAGAQPALARDEEPPVDDAAHPRALAEGEVATGRVHYDEDTDWYRLDVPAGQHSVTLTVGGPGTVGAALALRTLDGVDVPATFGPGDEPGTVAYRAGVEPASSYLVEVRQPRSSIVVSFDSSASVATHLASIEAGLRTLAEGMSRDREALRIVPFDGRPLLRGWSSDPYEIADAVNRFSLGASSSAVERNLREAALDLQTREGGRAVLLITDAASSSFGETARLWAALAAARPEVFAVAISGEGERPAIDRHNLMADWASSAGGVSSQARGAQDVLEAFDRLATTLRRPAAYRLSYQTYAEEPAPPPPGHISVLAPQVDGRRPAVLAADGAVELVVDTSASMREPLGDTSRIEAARRVLTELVGTEIPAGVPVALRAFPSPSDRCGGRLLIPLGPLEPTTALSVIDGISAPKKAATPLARAITAVADDLSGVSGPRIVVVLSDGKESCKGDPAAAVKQLRRQGFDVTLNVVGLTLDKASRKAISRLAQLGGGSYFDAADPESLAAALRAAVSAPLEIRDGSGTVVARGTVGGEALEVEPGRYQVSVMTDPPVTFADVFVQPDADITLTLPEP